MLVVETDVELDGVFADAEELDDADEVEEDEDFETDKLNDIVALVVVTDEVLL